MDLNEALRQFDTVEANLAKVESAWKKMRAIIPDGLAFMGGSPEDREFRQLRRDYEHLLTGLPPIDGWRVTAVPDDLDAIAQGRLDAKEVGEFSAEVFVEEKINEPGEQIDEYRGRLTRKRRELVRARLAELMAEVDAVIIRLANEAVGRESNASVRCPEWEQMEGRIAEIDRLAGSGSRRGWGDFRRHLRFAQVCDLGDIQERDWPAVKEELLSAGFDDSEPLPVEVADLGALVTSRPSGAVSTALKWDVLDEEDFERLVFAVIADASGYENPEWLMRTHAPDRGRDLSVWRIRDDALSGVSRERVIIQCKHWLSTSVGDTDIANTLTKISHWEPPPIAVLVVATSGRFTADGVRWVEQYNHAGKHPRIDLWPESHLERLLAQRPHLVASFKLR